MTGRLWLIVVCNIALSVVTLAVSPLPSAALELMISLFTFAVAFVLQVALMKAVEREMSFSEAATDLQAATALLQLTCDAVIELDATLRLVEHSDDLAAILLRPGLSLVGTKFEDLLAGPEERRAALQLLRQPRTSGVSSSIVAQAFRTRLVDSCASKFSCESFHVKYQKPDGCHRPRVTGKAANKSTRRERGGPCRQVQQSQRATSGQDAAENNLSPAGSGSLGRGVRVNSGGQLGWNASCGAVSQYRDRAPA